MKFIIIYIKVRDSSVQIRRTICDLNEF